LCTRTTAELDISCDSLIDFYVHIDDTSMADTDAADVNDGSLHPASSAANAPAVSALQAHQ